MRRAARDACAPGAELSEARAGRDACLGKALKLRVGDEQCLEKFTRKDSIEL